MNFSNSVLPVSEKSLRYKKVCLHCGRENTSQNYTCNCSGESWQQEYRTLGLDYELGSAAREIAWQSFRNYDFESPRGMLQYALLPFAAELDEVPKKVGLTPLYHLPRLGAYYGSDLYIKNEGDNPSGCFKDRETLLCLLNARHKNLEKAVIYSSGNAAASAALFARDARIHLLTFVAGDTYEEKIEFIRNRGSDVIAIGDEQTNFEEGYRLFSSLNSEGLYGNFGYDNWSIRNPYRVQGDKTTALEIVLQLSPKNGPWIAPDFVIVPTANGSCLSGMWRGFQELYQLGIINRLPAMASVGIENANPVFEAVRRRKTGRPTKCDISKLDEEDARIGSIIVAEEGYDSIQAAKAVLESGGEAVAVRREHIKKALTDFLEKEKQTALEHAILPEPASFTALAAVELLKEKGTIKPADKVVAVITGHGLKAREVIHELIGRHAEWQAVADKIIRMRKEDMNPPTVRKGRRVQITADGAAVARAFLNLSLMK